MRQAALTLLSNSKIRFSRAMALAVLLLAAVGAPWAHGQATGDVEAIGFNGVYRPNAWTPMLVRLRPTTSSPFEGKLVVTQNDLDKDRVLYTRPISLTGNAEGGSIREQKFWMYFIPEPTELPTNSLSELSERLTVQLFTTSGRAVARLRVTQTVQSAEPEKGMTGAARGNKFVLFVTGERSVPPLREFSERAMGIAEDVTWARVSVRDLPENVLGYDALDAIVWMDADPTQLSHDQLQAVKEWVRHGGRLVICQTGRPGEWQRNSIALGDLMPVVVTRIETVNEARVLRDLATSRRQEVNHAARTWEQFNTPMPLARSQPKSSAIVTEWTPDGIPYIVRACYGLGAVTWVAQDLGDSAFATGTRNSAGWIRIWSRIFDWNADPIAGEDLDPLREPDSQRLERMYGRGDAVDLAYASLSGMNVGRTAALLVGLAILFFIAYWLVAGPVSYLVLLKRAAAGQSWFAFALVAIVATVLTAIIVRVVVRGPPELKHVSYVRQALNQPAVVRSHIGLYVKRDGVQQITLKDAVPTQDVFVTSFPLNRRWLSDVSLPAHLEYEIPVMEAGTVRIPYRSTLKKLQAQWVGTIDGNLAGNAKLLGSGFIGGNITNNTGRDLRNVYVAFRYPVGNQHQDWILFMPSWPKGQTKDLNLEFNGDKTRGPTPMVDVNSRRPSAAGNLRGRMGRQNAPLEWDAYWLSNLSRADFSERFTEDNVEVPRAFAMLSLYDRIPLVAGKEGQSSFGQLYNRTDLLRRGASFIDMSHSISSGGLLVLAQSEGPLPMPLEVEGDRVEGEGVTYYQFVLPLDRSELNAATKPATQAAEGS